MSIVEQDFRKKFKCPKCGQEFTIILQKSESYGWNVFVEYDNENILSMGQAYEDEEVD